MERKGNREPSSRYSELSARILLPNHGPPFTARARSPLTGYPSIIETILNKRWETEYSIAVNRLAVQFIVSSPITRLPRESTIFNDAPVTLNETGQRRGALLPYARFSQQPCTRSTALYYFILNYWRDRSFASIDCISLGMLFVIQSHKPITPVPIYMRIYQFVDIYRRVLCSARTLRFIRNEFRC